MNHGGKMKKDKHTLTFTSCHVYAVGDIIEITSPFRLPWHKRIYNFILRKKEPKALFECADISNNDMTINYITNQRIKV